MKPNRERLTVEVPKGWKAQLAEIGKEMERNASYLTRKALSTTYPQLTASEQRTNEAQKGGKSE